MAINRREFLTAASGAGALTLGASWLVPAARSAPPVAASIVEVLNPRMRVPLSFVIDDSSCLVNMGHFCMPQFAECYPQRADYQKPWKSWPREIPDSFVREFGEWCAEHGVKGKYSIVPYPACVGWLDRELPGWSRRELLDSLKLVRELMVPNWDIHPEMITHTRVIDLKAGRPCDEISPATMENSYPREKKSVDELASYLAYALRILKNCDLPCEGITTPGGFGNLVKPELALAVHDAVRDVYGTDLPHYFKYVISGEENTRPKLEGLRDLNSNDPKLTVNVPAATGDWFGGWDGDRVPEPDRYATADASSGRMVELIERGDPAVFLCHWPGMYTQGTKAGFQAFQQVVLALNQRFRDQTIWLKMSEIARYYAAAELTKIERRDSSLMLRAPFATQRFTLRIPGKVSVAPVVAAGETIRLKEVRSAAALDSGNWLREDGSFVVCFDLPKGESTVSWAAS
ncbi:hypothetical protein GC176_15980 [bacterium]|nr:hypothetical protein [bacterium]